MEESTEAFERPQVPQWDLFEDAAIKLFNEWDITQHAIDDEWAGGLTEEYCDRVLDFLLENFAERWLQGRGAKLDSVADFLADTVNDHFEVEIPHAVALPLSKVLVTLHEECRNGVLTGVTFVLGPERVEQVMRRGAQPEMTSEAKPQESAGNKPADQNPTATVATTPSEAQTAAGISTSTGVSDTQMSENPPTEDDGWTTVASSKKKGKKKGKQFD